VIDHRRPGGGLRGVLSKDQQLSGNSGYVFGQSTTTTVGAWVAMFGPIAVHVPIRNALLEFLMPLSAKHSAVDASFQIAVAIYENSDGSGAAENLMLLPHRLPNAAGAWDGRSWSGNGYLDIQAIPVGTRYMYVLAWNDIAGTLTYGKNNGYEYINWKVFGH